MDEMNEQHFLEKLTSNTSDPFIKFDHFKSF